jgi:hypothetical protein
MDAAPDTVAARVVDPSGRYRCPLCAAQSTSSDPDIGWVACPMIGDEYICLGCCLDYQYVARSERFDEHPYREDFDRIAQKAGKDVRTLRLICMRHQESVLVADLERGVRPDVERGVRELLEEVRGRVAEIEGAR